MGRARRAVTSRHSRHRGYRRSAGLGTSARALAGVAAGARGSPPMGPGSAHVITGTSRRSAAALSGGTGQAPHGNLSFDAPPALSAPRPWTGPWSGAAAEVPRLRSEDRARVLGIAGEPCAAGTISALSQHRVATGPRAAVLAPWPLPGRLDEPAELATRVADLTRLTGPAVAGCAPAPGRPVSVNAGDYPLRAGGRGRAPVGSQRWAGPPRAAGRRRSGTDRRSGPASARGRPGRGTRSGSHQPPA